jgi:predicted nucleotidyltransferase
VEGQKLFVCNVGSRLSGLHVDSSDDDQLVVTVGSKAQYVGVTPLADRTHHTVGTADIIEYDFRRFITHLLGGVYNCLAGLYAQFPDVQFVHPAMTPLIHSRNLFPTMATVHACRGHAHAEHAKMVQSDSFDPILAGRSLHLMQEAVNLLRTGQPAVKASAEAVAVRRGELGAEAYNDLYEQAETLTMALTPHRLLTRNVTHATPAVSQLCIDVVESAWAMGGAA